MPRSILSAALLVLLVGCHSAPMRENPGPAVAPQKAAAPKKKASNKPDVDINLLFFQRRRSAAGGRDWLLPLYTYDYSNETGEREFTIIPLASGCQVSPTSEYWFSLPLLTVYGGSRSEKNENTYFASLPLLSMARSDKTPWREQHEFVSLPLLAMSSKQIYRGSRGTVTHESSAAPAPLIYTERITREDRKGNNRLEILKRSILMLPLGEKDRGEDRFSVVDLERWGPDRQIRMFNLFNFSLFSFSRFQGRYPGSRFIRVASGKAVDEQQSKPSASEPFVTSFGVLGPMISFRTDGHQETRWEFLPLFHYHRKGEDTDFRIIPLLFHMRNGSPRISPIDNLFKLWPLLYYDEYKRRYDILWPLAYYRDDEIEDRTELRIRLLFRYFQKEEFTEVRLLDGLLYSHQGDDQKSSTSMLMGYLFSAESQSAEEYYRFDILRGLIFGMSRRKGEEPTYRFLFLTVGGKKIQEGSKK